jgi:hypothetical protein
MPRERKDLGVGGVAAEMGVDNPRLNGTVVKRFTPSPPVEEDAATRDKREMRVQKWPGGTFNPEYKHVRWCHNDPPCWAFTVTRTAHENFENGHALSHVGAVYPNGLPVVPAGTPPHDVALTCGTCGTQSVEFLQLRFFAE